MNVSQIKALTWLTALALGGMLGWTIYDRLPGFRNRIDPASGHAIWEDEKKAERILTSVTVPEETSHDLVPQAKVQKHFYELNWTGQEVKAPVVEVVEEKPPEKPSIVPVAELVRIVMIREEPAAPARSIVHLIYSSASGVSHAVAQRSAPAAPPAAAAPSRGGQQRGAPAATLASLPGSDSGGVGAMRPYRVGDPLEAPLDYIRIERISAREGVTFAFDDPERPAETLYFRDSGLLDGLLVRADRDEALRPVPREGIPSGNRMAAFGERTARVGENMFRLGFEDMNEIGQNYPSIISGEISHRRWVDPKTKQPGILLTRVQPGGVAAKHGLKEGDVIKSINGHPVGSPQEAITYVKNNADNYTTWLVVIENMGLERTVVYESP